jgi:DNA-binding MarR family transcriptional regulator
MYHYQMYFKDLYILGRALTDVAFRATGAAEQGLSASEFAVLQDVFDHEPTPISAITSRTGVAQSRVSTAVQHLAHRGYVMTRSEPSDRRKTIVEVTEMVRTEGARVRQLDISQALAPVFDGCDAAEREWVMSALERLTQLATPVIRASATG